MVSLWGEYNRGPAVRRLFWSLGRAFTCFPNRQPLYHKANDHLFSLFTHHSISRLLALTYFLVHCLSFRSGNIATYMISTSSFLPSLKSYISLGPSFRIFVGIFALAERLPNSATLGSGRHSLHISRIFLRTTQGQTKPFIIYMCGGATTQYGFEGIQRFAVTSAF